MDRLNRPLRDLRISVTDRCNFRCPYCMPADRYGEHYHFVPRREILTFEEVTRLVRVFVRAGVSKIRLTGGEPLLRQDLPELVRLVSAVPGVDDLALTTNGYLLERLAAPLRSAGLQRVTVSLDAADPATFRAMSGRDLDVAVVLRGIEAAREAGLHPIKINTVVRRGVNDGAILDLVERFRGTGHVLRFIEYMDVGNVNEWRSADVVPAAEIVRRIDAVHPLEPLGRRHAAEVAERYRFRDGGGEIGIVASVTQPFCRGCARARLSAEGRLYTCLFSGTGLSLRDPLRAGAGEDQLFDLVSGVWRARTDRYSEIRSDDGSADRKVEMFHIGG